MKQTLYLAKPGIISVKGQSLTFIDKDKNKRNFPIKEIDKIVCLSPISITSGTIKLLAKENVPIHFVNKFGILYNVLEPISFTISGKVTIEQVKFFLEKRLELAKLFVLGAFQNLQGFFKRYNFNLKDYKREILNSESISELMGYESLIWKESYRFLAEITGFEFEKRTKRPPKNELNALISFLNTLLYTDLINQGRLTYLNLSVSFLHEPQDSRFSLALDIAEIFKPVIVFPLITYLLNKKVLTNEDFEKFGKGILLNKKGKKKVLINYEKKVNETIKVKSLNKKVKYKTLFKLEYYKLLKHLLNDKEYIPYKHYF
jgi:CRISPR-associated protein Cas1